MRRAQPHRGHDHPLAQIGAKLGEEGQEVTKVKIRGVESKGMLCSERDLGLSDDHSGLMVLDPGLEPGLPLAQVLNLETQVLEISITPNRGDALSILGVARDVAALVGAELVLPPANPRRSSRASRARRPSRSWTPRPAPATPGGWSRTSRSAPRRCGCATGSWPVACGPSATWWT